MIGTTKGYRKFIKYPFFYFFKSFWLKRIKKLINECNNIFDNSDYVGCASWTEIGARCVYPKEWFGTGILLPFEDESFKIPDKYDDVLTKIYGEYMILPSEKERIAHHFYKIYRK